VAMKSRSFASLRMTALGVGLFSPWVLDYIIRRNGLAAV
jgi:hypothetical protein